MSGRNWSFLGNVADWYDRQTNRILVMRNEALQWVDPNDYSGRNSLLSPIGLWAAWGTGVVHFSQGLVDTLRIGNGIRRGGWGYAEDAMRALNLVDGAGRILGRVGRAMRVVLQQPGTFTCTWNAIFNALERTGNPIFISLRDMMHSVGTTEAAINAQGGTSLQLFRQLLGRLRLFNVQLEELRVSLAQTGWEALANHATIRQRGVFIVAFTYARQGANAIRSATSDAHHLAATFSREYGLIFEDTNGQVYAGLQALRAVYPEATLMRDYGIVFIHNTALVTPAALASTAARQTSRAVEQAAEAASSLFSYIVLPVVAVYSDAPPSRE